jgi:lipopolysaccharide transport system permease protein
MEEKEKWDIDVSPSTGLFDLKLKAVWRYRDLLLLLVRRDFVAVYKQTLLGPLWFLIQPLLTTLIFTIVFGKIAKIPTDGIPPILFYLSGITLWNYFADCVNATSDTFTKNASIFGKVYFPRVIVPISVISSNLIKFGIQFTLLIGFWVYFYVQGENFNLNSSIILLPYLILLMAGMGLGIGMIVSSLTTKYRDLTFLITFGVQLLMYASPVIYPLSNLPEKYRIFILANPMTSVIETFRFALLGSGDFNMIHLAYSSCFTLIILFLGIIVFNQVEKSFMDTV